MSLHGNDWCTEHGEPRSECDHTCSHPFVSWHYHGGECQVCSLPVAWEDENAGFGVRGTLPGPTGGD